MTIREALDHSTKRLQASGVPEASVDSEWLLAHVSGLKRLELSLHTRQTLSSEMCLRYLELVERRAKREPLQHLLGTVPFLEYELEVSPAALIPRPETEMLAERVIDRIRRLPRQQALRGLDLGTGTGCLPIAITATLEGVCMTALDVSPDALQLARRNIESHGLSDRIELRESDGFAQLDGGVEFDFLVSNPPYIPKSELADLQDEVRRFDPHLALDGGVDGLDFYRLIASEAGRFLKSGAFLLLEFGEGQAESIQAIFQENAWPRGVCISDLCGKERFLEFTYTKPVVGARS